MYRKNPGRLVRPSIPATRPEKHAASCHYWVRINLIEYHGQVLVSRWCLKCDYECGKVWLTVDKEDRTRELCITDGGWRGDDDGEN